MFNLKKKAGTQKLGLRGPMPIRYLRGLGLQNPPRRVDCVAGTAERCSRAHALIACIAVPLRRMPHSDFGQDFERQTFRCVSCHKEIERSADKDGQPHV